MYLLHEFNKSIDVWESNLKKLEDLLSMTGQALHDGLLKVMYPKERMFVSCSENPFLSVHAEIAVDIRKGWLRLRHACKVLKDKQDEQKAKELIQEAIDLRDNAFAEVRENLVKYYVRYRNMVEMASGESGNWKTHWKKFIKDNKTKVGDDYFIDGKRVNVD